MVRQCLILCSLLTIAGCTTLTPAERAARAEAEMDRMIAIYGPACEKLGYARDNDKWRDCVLQLSAQDNYRASRRSSTTCFGHRGFIDCTTM